LKGSKLLLFVARTTLHELVVFVPAAIYGIIAAWSRSWNRLLLGIHVGRTGTGVLIPSHAGQEAVPSGCRETLHNQPGPSW
jgi:hypothetical protein